VGKTEYEARNERNTEVVNWKGREISTKGEGGVREKWGCLKSHKELCCYLKLLLIHVSVCVCVCVCVCLYFKSNFPIWTINALPNSHRLAKPPISGMKIPLLSCWSEESKRLPQHYRSLLLLSVAFQRLKSLLLWAPCTLDTGLRETKPGLIRMCSRGCLTRFQERNNLPVCDAYNNDQHGITLRGSSGTPILAVTNSSPIGLMVHSPEERACLVQKKPSTLLGLMWS